MKQIYFDLMNSFLDYEGRTNRKQFLIFILFNIILIPIVVLLFIWFLLLVIKLIPNEKFYEIAKTSLIMVYFFGLIYLLIGFVVVLIRRLHDTAHSGKYLFASLIPGGIFYVIILLCSPSKDANNKYNL
jgi:uncharacterized membrane protein YhaH (DUF805 family)